MKISFRIHGEVQGTRDFCMIGEFGLMLIADDGFRSQFPVRLSSHVGFFGN